MLAFGCLVLNPFPYYFRATSSVITISDSVQNANYFQLHNVLYTLAIFNYGTTGTAPGCS
jgi:hypothetical protein